MCVSMMQEGEDLVLPTVGERLWVIGGMLCHTALSCCCAKLPNAHGGAVSKEHREKTVEGEQCAFVHRVRV